MPSTKADRGFSLIELMVVMMILAILISLSLVAFGRFQTRGEDAKAQSSLRNGLIAEQAIYTDTGAYSDTPADFTDFEPEVTVNTTSASDPGVYVDKFSDMVVCIHELAGDGKVFAVWLHGFQAPQYGTFADQTTASAFVCNNTPPGWSTQGW